MNWDHTLSHSPFPQVIETEAGLNRGGQSKVPIPFTEIPLASIENRILKSLRDCKMKCAIWWFTAAPWVYLGFKNMVPIAFPTYSQLSHPLLVVLLIRAACLMLGTYWTRAVSVWAAAVKVRSNLSTASLDISTLPLEIILIRKLLTEANPAASHCNMMAMGYTKVSLRQEAESSLAKKYWCQKCAVTLYQAGGWN